ncbi:hypothetical protein JS958_003084 [Salmonella enterica subsp. enterica serovar Infantis]|nr:hypothetical protein [Salmonella enterica]EHA1743117.1 hypothetical protein [Salmonella enterica subsp. enterica serovar Javiana]EHC4525249.1 hypothetical protein [Salmonella enterica subsp. enterica serovar Infantis]ELD4653736.1 hypothetical protein [Salmonella enterica subsp. enterica serovar Javiana]
MSKNNTGYLLLMAVTIYLSSGAILGFIQVGWPLLLQRQGMPVQWVSLVILLVLPFAICALWAPLVDRFWMAKLGRRRSWIAPMQLLIAGVLLVAIRWDDQRSVLVTSLGIASFCAATLDVALDALLIENCWDEKQIAIRGPLKVAGMLAGGLAGSTLSVWLYSQFNMAATLMLLEAMAILPLLFIVPWRETSARVAAGAGRGWFDFRRFFAQPGSKPMMVMAVMLTGLIEMGLEGMRLYLVSRHIPLPTLSLLLGPVAGIVGIIGAIAGGLLGRRFGLLRVIIACGIALGLLTGVLSLAAASFGHGDMMTFGWFVAAGLVYTMLTSCLFSFSMLWCQGSAHLASDFASIQSAWIFSGIAGASLSGLLIARTGWSGAFAGIASFLLLLCLIIPRRFSQHPYLLKQEK